jgi:hypothetical protein
VADGADGHPPLGDAGGVHRAEQARPKNELDAYSQGRLFVAGLPAEVKYEVLLKHEVCSPTGSVNHLKAFQATKAFVETEQAF